MSAETTTEVEVCNQALLYTGTGQTINSLTENTMESRACKVHSGKTRVALLQAFPWKFATKRATLALLAGEARTGWAYTYELPSDCISPRFLWAGSRMPNAIDKIPFDIETVSAASGAVAGLCLLTDQKAAELIYTADVRTVSLWSPLFVDAVAWALAVKLCLILPVKPEWAKNAKFEAVAAFNKAGAAEFRGSQQDPNPPSEYTSAR